MGVLFDGGFFISAGKIEDVLERKCIQGPRRYWGKWESLASRLDRRYPLKHGVKAFNSIMIISRFDPSFSRSPESWLLPITNTNSYPHIPYRTIPPTLRQTLNPSIDQIIYLVILQPASVDSSSSNS